MDNYPIVTDVPVIDADGDALILGAKYEMYAPIAKMAEEGVALVWADDVGYSFTYEGVVDLLGQEYICTSDVSYVEGTVPEGLSSAADELFNKEGGIHPLCPVYVAAKFVRPVTGE